SSTLSRGERGQKRSLEVTPDTTEAHSARRCSQDRDSLDFDQEFRSSKGAHLDQCRDWKVTTKKLTSCLPDFFATRDIGDKDVHLHDIIHVAPSRLYEVLDLGEHSMGLRIHAAAARDLGASASGHTSREHLIPHYETVGPGLRGWLGNMGTTHA